MHDALSMVRLDAMTIKPYIKSYLLLLLNLNLINILGYDPASFTLIISSCTLLASGTVFSIEDKDRLGPLYASLAISRKVYLRGRYIFLFLHYALGALLSLLVSGIIAVAKGVEARVFAIDLASGLIMSMAYYAVMLSIQAPFYLRYGYAKGILITLIPTVAFLVWSVAAASAGFVGPMRTAAQLIGSHTLLAALSGIALSAAAVSLSYAVAMRIHRYLK